MLKDIVFPATLFDLVQGIARADDGRIIVSTTTNFVILEPALLTNTPPPGGIHPAVIGVVPDGAAGPTTFAVSGAGLAIASARGRSLVTHFGPGFRLVNGAVSGAIK